LADWKNISEAGYFHLMTQSKRRYRNGFRSRMFPSTAKAWKISLYVTTSAWISLETMWKNKGLMSNDICVLFLSPLTSSHVKKK
jgi:hypothetical protein